MKRILVFILVLMNFGCQMKGESQEIKKKTMEVNDKDSIATFAGGCFWCTEAVFLEINGVKSVTSGYIGGKTKNPTYEEICTGETGHAEAIRIIFDPNLVSFDELLEIFFATHDPTTLNRQGNDIGTQYRSEVFYHNEDQKLITEKYIQLLNKENTFGKNIVTQVTKASTFYPAEKYHQNYYNQNKTQGYCTYVITPKVEKVRKEFKDKLKK